MGFSHSRWNTKPISQTCEVLVTGKTECGSPTTYAYAAMGGGWMALCTKHGKKHRDIAEPIGELLAAGETMSPNA